MTLDSIPDESTILRFRHFLDQHELTKKLFQSSEQYLSEHGLNLREGTIVDASIVSAPNSTKNKDRKRDLEMKRARKATSGTLGRRCTLAAIPRDEFIVSL